MATSANSSFNKFPKFIGSLLEPFNKLGDFEQAAFLTLPLLLLYVEDHWYVKTPVVVLSLAGLVFQYLRQNAFYWLALSCFMILGICYNWPAADNHKYLMVYWCLALFFTHLFHTGEMALKYSARYLAGFAFAFAVTWKMISPDFLSGIFFEYTFHFDSRFIAKLKILGLLDPGVAGFNFAAKDALVAYDSNLYEADILLNNKLDFWAKLLAWWSFLLEGMIALCFLLPVRYKLAPFGDILLLLFIFCTYLATPVTAFGWILAIFGFIQCDAARWKTRMVYILVILLLQVYRLPWATVTGLIS